MARHSFAATIINLTNQQLNLQSQSCDHGEITHGPDQVIKPMSTSFCRTESTTFSIGDHAKLTYGSELGQQIEIYWHDNGFGSISISGTPQYSVGQNPPANQALSVAHTTDIADGAHASVIFVVYHTPTVQQKSLATSSSTNKVNPLNSCDLVLSISEQAINEQISNLCFNGLIDQHFEYKDVNSFSADAKSITISITETTKSTQRFKCKIAFESGTFTYNGKDHNMTGWVYAFDVAYSLNSFTNNSENIKLHVPTKLVSTVQESVKKLATDSLVPDSQFTIQQLFLDMVGSAGNYDKTNSNLDPDPKVSFAFLFLFGNCLKNLNLKENPYVLSYPVTISSANVGPKIYPSDVRLYPTFDIDPKKRSLNYLMMTNGRKFSDHEISLSKPLLNGQKAALFVSYDLFNSQYLANLIDQISSQLETQFGKFPFPVAQLTSSEKGNYSWATFQQNSGNADQFVGGEGNYKDFGASYGQGFALNLTQFSNSSSNYLALNLEMMIAKSLQEGHIMGTTYANGFSSSWVSALQENSDSVKIAAVIEPGSQGTVQVRVTEPQAGKSLQIFNDMPSTTADSVNKWVMDADSKFLKQFGIVDKIKLTFDSTFTNSVIFPISTILFYKNMTFLNQTSVDQKNLPIGFVSSLTGLKSIPIGPSCDNAIILEAEYNG